MALVEHAVDRLYGTARYTRWGVAWDTIGEGTSHELTGLAHGASGCALALAEYACAVGDEQSAAWAVAALQVENRHFLPHLASWRDLRHPVLREVLSGRIALTAAPAAIEAYEERPMVAWCHGTAGIALARLRLEQLLVDRIELHVRAGVEATIAHWALPEWNFSLCHGFGGNADVLLHAAEQYADPRLRELVAQKFNEACIQFCGSPDRWPVGAGAGVPDHSLLLGLAGVGYSLLRLEPSPPPSVLILCDIAPPQTTLSARGMQRERLQIALVSVGDAARDLSAAAAEATLGIRATHAAESSLEAFDDELCFEITDAQFEHDWHGIALRRAWRQVSACPPGDVRRRLVALARVCRHVEDLYIDHTRPIRNGLRVKESSVADSLAGEWRWAPTTLLLRTSPRTLAALLGEEPAGARATALLLHAEGRRIRWRVVGPFVQSVLLSARTSQTGHAIAAQLSQRLRWKDTGIEERVCDQLRMLGLRGILEYQPLNTVERNLPLAERQFSDMERGPVEVGARL
jgi:hypothetical protein